MDASILPTDVVIQAFLDVQLLYSTHQTTSALGALATIQKMIDVLKVCVTHKYYILRSNIFTQFGTNGLQQHQHNLLEDLGEEESSEGDDKDGDEDNELPSTPSGTSTPQNLDSPSSSEPHSPEQKRARISKDHNTEILDLVPITFEAFDSLPILSRSKSKWNKLLQNNPGFWTNKCSSWASALQVAFIHRTEITVCELSILEYSAKFMQDNDQQEYYQNVVDVLREMRQVQASTYKQEDWKKAIQVK